MRWRDGLALLVLLGLGAAGAGASGGYELEAVLTPDVDRPGGELFGVSFAVDGDTLAVGAPSARIDGVLSGAAYVFERRDGRWVQTARLGASDAASRDRFGSWVDLSGDTLVVSARGRTVRRGVRGGLYVFERRGDAWIQTDLLEPEPGSEVDDFGRTAAAGRGRIAVPESGAPVPRVLIYERRGGGWLLDSVVDGGRAALYFVNDLRGRSMIANLYLIGGSFQNGLGFVRRSGGSWALRETLLPLGRDNTNLFGVDHSRSGKRLLVGVPPQLFPPDSPPGSALLYRRQGGRWVVETRLEPTPPGPGEPAVGGFGDRVAMGRKVLLVSAVDMTEILGSGTVYVFARRGGAWEQEAKLVPPGDPEEDFGREVDVEGDTLFVGSPRARGGRIYVYRSTAETASGR